MLLPPTLFRFSFSWRVHYARCLSGPAHDEPTSYIAPSSPLLSSPFSFLPACRHPAPLWCTLCVSVFMVFTSTIQHLSTCFSLVSFQSPASLSFTLPLSLALNKKSLLIARNLWDSRSLSTYVENFSFSPPFIFIFTFIFLISLRSRRFFFLGVLAFVSFSPVSIFPSRNKLCNCFYYCLQIIYTHVRICAYTSLLYAVFARVRLQGCNK